MESMLGIDSPLEGRLMDSSEKQVVSLIPSRCSTRGVGEIIVLSSGLVISVIWVW